MIRDQRHSPFGWLALWWLLSCGLVGCRASTAPITDVASATRLLESSLSAWKSGRTVAEMRQQIPPTYVADDLWLQGFQLKDYQVHGQGESFGTNVRFQVTLRGSTANGKTSERKVKYLVATQPANSVAREDR